MKYIELFNLQKSLEKIQKYPSIKSRYLLKRNQEVISNFMKIIVDVEKSIFTENVMNFEMKKSSMSSDEIKDYLSTHKEEFDVFVQNKKQFDDLLNQEAEDCPPLLKITIDDLPDDLTDEQSQSIFHLVD